MTETCCTLPSVLIATLLVLGGCVAEQSNHDVTYATEQGVAHIHNDGPGLWAHRDTTPVAFELEQTYGAEETPPDAMLGAVSSVTVGDEGRVYVLDRQAYQIKAFGADGALRWTTGREGEGPGELSGYYWQSALVHNGEDALYLSNRNGSRIDRIETTDGTFTESYTLAEDLNFASLVGMGSDGNLLLKTSAWGYAGTNTHRLDLETGTVSDHAEIRVRKEPYGEDDTAYTIALTTQGDSLVGRFAKDTYELWTFDAAGTPARVVTRALDTMIGNGIYEMEGGGLRIESYSRLDGPFEMPNGYKLTYRVNTPDVRDPDEHLRRREEDGIDPPTYRAAIDVFRSDGAFLGAVTWPDTREPEVGIPIAMDADGHLYTRTDDPYPQVRRYAVTINP